MPLIIILLRPFFKFFVISPLLDALVRLKIIFLINPTDVDDDDDDDVVDADSNDQEEHNYLNKFLIFRLETLKKKLTRSRHHCLSVQFAQFSRRH
jgi:hypothetical protein